jgi:hypothetical protein
VGDVDNLSELRKNYATDKSQQCNLERGQSFKEEVYMLVVGRSPVRIPKISAGMARPATVLTNTTKE